MCTVELQSESALCCLNIFGAFFYSPPLPPASKFNLCGFNSDATGRTVFRQCFKIAYGVRVTNMTTCEQFPGLSGRDAGLQLYGPQVALWKNAGLLYLYLSIKNTALPAFISRTLWVSRQASPLGA